MLPRGFPEARLLSRSSPTIPRLAGIGAFWQGKAFLLRYYRYGRFTGNTLFVSPFHAGCRITVMLWLRASAALLVRRDMFAVTYRPLLAVLLVLLRSRSLWTCERWGHKGFLVNNEPLQCDYLP